MELNHFLEIVRRSWLLALLPPLLALTVGLVGFDLPPQQYGLTARLAVTQTGIAPSESSFPDFNSYHSWAASEYVADDLPQIVSSAVFAADIQSWLKQQRGIELSAPAIEAGLSADRVHRVLNLHITASAPEHARAIAEAAAALLQQKGLAYWNRREQGGLDVSLLELPAAMPQNHWRQPAWTLTLRVVLALAVGLILAFARYYLDATVRDEQDLEALGLPVLAGIPADEPGGGKQHRSGSHSAQQTA